MLQALGIDVCGRTTTSALRHSKSRDSRIRAIRVAESIRRGLAKGEPQPSQHFRHEVDQCPRYRQHVPIMPECSQMNLMAGRSATVSNICGVTVRRISNAGT
jgi:hypothetical protein